MYSKTHLFFSQSQISPFYKIMLKTKLFLEKMIEKTLSKQNIVNKKKHCVTLLTHRNNGIKDNILGH